jgi:RNA polymerase sigma factor for flagellar operon FliA
MRETLMELDSDEVVPELTAEQREQIILDHLPQVRLIARRIHERLPDHINIDDLISAGTLGLISAVDNFDSSQNVQLKTYAEYRIRGAILDSLRGMDFAPRQKRRQARQIEAAMAACEQRRGRPPSEEEIADELGLSLDEYREWLVELEHVQIGEFDAPNGPASSTVLRRLADDHENLPSVVLERAELERLLGRSIGNLPKVERTVLALYYKEELNLREIAGIMDLHLSRISQLKSQAVLRLRSAMQKRWPAGRGF